MIMVKSWFGRYRCEICGKFVNPNIGCSCGEPKNSIYFRKEDEDKWLTKDKLVNNI